MGNSWVIFAYAVVYGFMVAYGAYTTYRIRTLRRQLGDE